MTELGHLIAQESESLESLGDANDRKAIGVSVVGQAT